MQRKKDIVAKKKRPAGIREPITTGVVDRIKSATYWIVAPRWLFLRIETEQGYVGWGEGTLEGRVNVVAAQLDDLGEFLVDANADNITFLHEQMRRQPFYAYGCPVMGSAISAIDTALWDIKAKRAQTPLCDLLGGRLHDKMRLYHWFGGNIPQVETTERQLGVVDWVEALIKNRNVSNGMFFKMNALPFMGLTDANGAIEHARKVLEALHDKYAGTKIKFGIDCHGQVNIASARSFLAMANPFSDILLFIEELVPVSELHMFPQLASETSIPLATGERLYEIPPFRSLTENAGVSIVQPDVAHANGVTFCHQIGKLASTSGIDTSYHCPNGPVSAITSVQMKVTHYGEAPQEFPEGIHYSGENDFLRYVANPKALKVSKDSFLTIPEEAGIGITLSETELDKGSRRKLWEESSCYSYNPLTGTPYPY